MLINKLLLSANIKIPRNLEEYKYLCEIGYRCIVKIHGLMFLCTDRNYNVTILSKSEIKLVIKKVQHYLNSPNIDRDWCFYSLNRYGPSVSCSMENCKYRNSKICVLYINEKDCILKNELANNKNT